jgi:hypothetical protein
VVATLGKLPGLDEGVRRGWEKVADLLDGRSASPQQGRLDWPQPAVAPAPQWTQVDVRGLRVEQVHDFGQIYLALSLWRRLGFSLGPILRCELIYFRDFRPRLKK